MVLSEGFYETKIQFHLTKDMDEEELDEALEAAIREVPEIVSAAVGEYLQLNSEDYA